MLKVFSVACFIYLNILLTQRCSWVFCDKGALILFTNAFDNCKNKSDRLTEKLVRAFILSYWVLFQVTQFKPQHLIVYLLHSASILLLKCKLSELKALDLVLKMTIKKSRLNLLNGWRQQEIISHGKLKTKTWVSL